MSFNLGRRRIISTAAVMICSNNCMAVSQHEPPSQNQIEKSLIETYSEKIKYQKNFPAIKKTGPVNTIYINRIFPPDELKHLDFIAAKILIRNTNSWNTIYEKSINFEKIRGYIVQENFICHDSNITASLLISNIERNTKTVIL